MSRKPHGAKRALWKYDLDYKIFKRKGVDSLSPLGFKYSVIDRELHSPKFSTFEDANKKRRGRMLATGTVGLLAARILRYQVENFNRRHDYIVMEREIEYLKNKPLNPLLKWPGGKSSDLKHLRTKYPEFFPLKIERYYEPFLGGGAVWLAADAKEMFVNDICDDLIDFYEYIRNQDYAFFSIFDKLDAAWDLLREIAVNGADDLYHNDKNALSKHERSLSTASLTDNCFQTISKIVASKIKRIKVVESQVIKDGGEKLSNEDLLDNVESALKAGYYTYIRDIFNKSVAKSALRTAAFYFLRDYCFSSMFRYNSKGDFNVPYGGVSYNNRSPSAKIKYWQSPTLIDHLQRTTFGRTDFEEFLNFYKPSEKDFIFIDPPYDTEFSTYDKKEFGQTEQERLADYLINKTNAQFMAVMKHTPYILSLYDGKKDIVCHSFDKDYQVSFRNRNDRKVTHLVACRIA